MTDRAADFHAIRITLGQTVVAEKKDALVVLEDSLQALRRIPSDSVSLILCDPPYHSTKKANVFGDRAFREDAHFLDWMEEYALEWQRIMRMNGTLYIFCSSQMSARLEVMMSAYLRPLNHITWTKPNDPGYDGWKGKMNKRALRQWYPHSERILMFEQGGYGDLTASRRSPMGAYLRECRLQSGLTAKELTGAIGAFGRVNNGGAVANWEAGRNTPSREQYDRMVDILEASGQVENMLDYEDLVRAMDVDPDSEFTDVWSFTGVKPFKGKHPAEKPLDLLAHIIRTSSYPGDIVLDCFAGSGSTGIAALRLGRRAICIEIEDQWARRMASEFTSALVEEDEPTGARLTTAAATQQQSLFQ